MVPYRWAGRVSCRRRQRSVTKVNAASPCSVPLADHFDRTAWLNPEPEQYWHGNTIEYIRNVFDMYPLTLSGLGEAVTHLVKGRRGR
jgi:uncharacterized protein with von Willebrand factor type A (vWA) domain